MNHLEQLTAEWYEFRGYFVRRNAQVGRRDKGGYECELDVVAFCPKSNHLVHVEPSMDADTWSTREARYQKKFEAGRKHIRLMFEGLELPETIDQIALLGFASNANVKMLAGGRVMTSAEFLKEITAGIGKMRIASAAIPEQYPLLRTIQFAYQHRHAAGWS
jgi:hypothetical protein